MSKNTKLVYSTDPDEMAKINSENKKNSAGLTPSLGVKSHFVAIFRIEKNQRGGKVVTVIYGLPKVESFLKELSKELKAKCGVGGTYKLGDSDGLIEMQGDQREKAKKILDTKGIKYKGM